jgi:hypothetical protein
LPWSKITNASLNSAIWSSSKRSAAIYWYIVFYVCILCLTFFFCYKSEHLFSSFNSTV